MVITSPLLSNYITASLLLSNASGQSRLMQSILILKVIEMSDTIISLFNVPLGVDGESLPYKTKTETEADGELKKHSAVSFALSPIKHLKGRATYCIKPYCKKIDGNFAVVAYEVSVSIPGAVCGLNALLENNVSSVSKLALFFLHHWLLENKVSEDVVKKFTLHQCELQELHLTYLIESGTKQEANNRILELAQRGLTLFSGEVIKKNKRKAAVEYRNSDGHCYTKISKCNKFDIAAYVKSYVTPKSFCGLSTDIAKDIFKISQKYVRYEVKLKKAWFSETVVVEDAEGKKVKKKQPSKWASPLSWKGRAGKAMYEQVFEEARDLLRLNEKFNQRRHRPDFMKTLSDEHRAILSKHYAGTSFKKLPFKSKDAKQRSKVKRAIQKLCGVDLSIPWGEQKDLVQLTWLRYPGMFSLDSVPEELHDYAFAGATIKKKLEEMKEKLRELADLNEMHARRSAFHRPAERSVSDMTEAELASDLMGTV